ncbi:diguanylate cyclase [Aurantiacibacter flavus]|uniref:diguanylate cyclase n=1 Tax=Aurantiacibacter flavus TaxID=3145232 RepID=A0ABV0D125_9SPHN
MVHSLSIRIIVLCALLCVVLALFGGLLIFTAAQTRESLHWISHSSRVLGTAGQSINHLRAAESGQRGFLLTRNPEFGRTVESELLASQDAAAHLVQLTADNALQSQRAQRIQELIEERAAGLNAAFKLGQQRDFEGALESVATGRARAIMPVLEARISDFIAEERSLSDERTERAGNWLELIRLLVFFGIPAAVIAVGGMAVSLIRRIQRPVEQISAVMGRLGAGDRTARIETTMASREFARLAKGYNTMAAELEAAVSDQTQSAEQLRAANNELALNADILRKRGEVIELLGGMAHRMHSARTDEELASIIEVFVPRVLPGVPGALYAHNNSRNLLLPIASWSEMEIEREGFSPEQCWALRRGQSHFVTEAGSDIVCAHVPADTEQYHCEPLLAGGEVIGVVYLEGVIDEEAHFRLTVLTENIASALVNHRLQRGLREQTIRDPLTGLFNRRYMQEMLHLEIARAARNGTQLSVVMCDVDHFKRFNDEFGHDAGDAVLQAVSTELRKRFRDGDVVCRYGGEEFTIVAPDTMADVLAARTEIVRQAISELNIKQGGRTLGSTSMSFGIASWSEGMDREGTALIQAADAALYRAKTAGRNRVAVAQDL